MISLATPLAKLPGLGVELTKKFSALGIRTMGQALWHFPFRHEDWRHRVAIKHLVEGEEVTIVATIVSIKSRRAWRRKLVVTEAKVTDASRATLNVVWFNQPYLATWFKPGQVLYLSGVVTKNSKGRQMQNPVYERPTADPLHQHLVPVYPSTAGLSQWHIRKVMKQAVALVNLVPEILPPEFLPTYDLCPRSTALHDIHFPDSPEKAAAAVRRLKFDELLAWQLAWQLSYHPRNIPPAPAIPFRELEVRQFVQSLPWQLTADQRLTAWQIIQDMNSPIPMSRLVQGDVGSGKTVVAAIAAYNAVRNGWQVALLAPTVVLAEQHWQTLQQTIGQHDVVVALLTGRAIRVGQESDWSRERFVQALSQGEINLVVATHAVLDEALQWKQLGLVVVDEQQRFGVAQRQALLQRPDGDTRLTPHFLSLTATPIPRTLALFLAGELSISSIRQKPPGRLPITTEVLGPDQRPRVDQAITQTIARQEQVYVITPLITESDVLGVRAATTEHERLRQSFPHQHVGLLHGQLLEADRLHIVDQFRRGHIDILVSTTVIEVGVDVPNATLMVIEGAERFGLAQLHQLRGRVGRSSKPSVCFLVTDDAAPAIQQRLQRVATTSDGFALADLDLELRGAGDLYGLRQSGLPEWRLATLQDIDLFTQTRAAADELLRQAPEHMQSPAWQSFLDQAVVGHRE